MFTADKLMFSVEQVVSSRILTHCLQPLSIGHFGLRLFGNRRADKTTPHLSRFFMFNGGKFPLQFFESGTCCHTETGIIHSSKKLYLSPAPILWVLSSPSISHLP